MTVRIPPNNFALDGSGKMRNRYHARIPVTHTPEQVMSPDYFGEVMRVSANSRQAQLTPGDLIEVEAEDFSWDCTLRVHAQVPSTQQLITRLRGEVNFYETNDFPKGWTAEWLGSAEHFGIYHDGKVVETGFATKDAALSRVHALVQKDMLSASTRAAVNKAANRSAGAKKSEEAA
jgi:hypothetical protein